MKRSLRPSLVTTSLPTLATLAGFSFGVGCTRGQPMHGNPPPQINPLVVADAGVPLTQLVPTRVDPANMPVMYGGAPMAVTPEPPTPRPQPSPAMAPSPAPMAPAPAAMAPSRAPMAAPAASAPLGGAMVAADGLPAGSAPGVYLTHNHPPGTPCHPVSQAEIREHLARLGAP